MRSIIFAIVLGVLAAPVAAQRAGAAKADPSKAVRAAFDRLMDGVRQVDAGKVMDAYVRSDQLLIFNNNGTATMGWENVKANVDSSYAKISNVTLDITGLRVEMLGARSAYVTCKWKQTQEYEGKVESSTGRMTLVFALVAKEWKVVHRHTSPDKPEPTRIPPSERQAE